MAITLSDINVTLQEQNETLRDQAQSTKSLNSNISVLVKEMRGSKLDEREAEIERSNKERADKAEGKSRAGAGASGGLGIKKGLFAGLLAGAGALIYDNFDIVKGIFMNIGAFVKSIVDHPSVQWALTELKNIDWVGAFTGIFDVVRTLGTSFLEGVKKITEGDYVGALKENWDGLGAAVLALLAFSKTARTLAMGAVKGLAKVGGAAFSAITGPKKTPNTAAKTKPSAPKIGANVTGPAAGSLKPPQMTGGTGPKVDIAKQAATKFPRFGALSKVATKIPVIGTLLSAGALAAILAGDGSKEEKVSGVAGLVGGVGGAALGGLVGSLLLPGIGTIGGALIGALAGDTLATAFAQWLTGQKVDAFPFDWANNLANGKKEEEPGLQTRGLSNGVGSALGTGTSGRTGDGIGPMLGGPSGRTGNGVGPMLSAPRPQTAPAVAALTRENAANANKQTVVIQDGSSRTVNNVSSSNQGLVLPSPSPFNSMDPFHVMRGAY